MGDRFLNSTVLNVERSGRLQKYMDVNALVEESVLQSHSKSNKNQFADFQLPGNSSFF
jgi:flagellar biosynthesis regulator FlbT